MPEYGCAVRVPGEAGTFGFKSGCITAHNQMLTTSIDDDGCGLVKLPVSPSQMKLELSLPTYTRSIFDRASMANVGLTSQRSEETE